MKLLTTGAGFVAAFDLASRETFREQLNSCMANPKFLMTHLIYLLMRRLEERSFDAFIPSHSHVGTET